MINANELRIGNLVSWINNEINGDKTHVINHYDFDNTEFFEPIILTEEKLKEFGFSDAIYVRSKHLEKDNLVFWKTDDDEFALCDVSTEVHIKYIHQLQNLYFALKQKELTLTK